MTKTVLVLGATGGVGHEVAQAFLRRGWHVKALARRPMASGDGIDWIVGDAMRADDVARAAEGATLLFHGVNPPGYKNWRGLAVPMLANAIRAAKASGARLLYPGNLYVYGPDAWTRVAEHAPRHPLTRKGRIRVEMEDMLAAAAAEGLRYLMVRAGDFFGPKAPSSWATTVLMGGGAPTRIQTPERPGVRHAWAYLPDLGETFARLAEHEAELGATEAFQFGGHVLEGRAMAEAVRRAAGGTLPIRAFPWALATVAAPFNTTMRELIEMRYLWRAEIVPDNARLVRMLGAEPHTGLDEAVGAAWRGVRKA